MLSQMFLKMCLFNLYEKVQPFKDCSFFELCILKALFYQANCKIYFERDTLCITWASPC